MALEKWDVLASEPVFENRWWKIVKETVELPDGGTWEHYVNHTHGGAVVFALTEEGNLLVNRQYKHGAREIVTELTIGKVDPPSPGGFGGASGDDGSPLESARRELLEETGYGGGTWEPLATYLSNPTSSTGRIHAFLALGVRKLAAQKDDPRERIEVREVPLDEAWRMLRAGEFSTHAGIATIFLALLKLGKLELKP
jgi:8-oxo-dGTP pyrophosphatase MutT (NUDIX family)